MILKLKEPPVIVPSTPFDPDNIYYGDDDYREELPKLGVGSDREKDLDNFYDPKVERDTGLEAIRQQNIADLENIDKMDTTKFTTKYLLYSGSTTISHHSIRC